MTTRSTFGKELPPTGFTSAHLESLPSQQINGQPIHRLVQEHVMEREAGHERGSMLVQYNCQAYTCEPRLVDSLTEIVKSYPPYVYLAPYPTMDAKIALATPGKSRSMSEDSVICPAGGRWGPGAGPGRGQGTVRTVLYGTCVWYSTVQ